MTMLVKKPAYRVAIVGATGAVGAEMIEVLEERKFPIETLIPLASARSAGGTVLLAGQDVTILELTKDSFEGVDIALFSAGAGCQPRVRAAGSQGRCGGDRQQRSLANG